MRNLRQHSGGWQKYTRAGGSFASEWTEDKPTLEEVRDWVGQQRPGTRRRTPEAPGDTTIEEDVPTYLASVAAMPSIADRRLHMAEWARHFRGRTRNTITAAQIAARLHQWRATLSASSCNKRRTALMSFYTRMNGRSGYNPVRDVAKFVEEEEPRAQRVFTIYRVLAFMEPSRTRARLMVILWTGWPHAQLQRLKPSHLDLAHARAFVTPRRKGRGRKGTWLPLLPQAVKALRDFIKWDCFTPTHPKTGKLVPFSTSAMHSSFGRALAQLNAHRQRLALPALNIRPYDLRHTFGTYIAERITDERAIQELMMHSRSEQSRRYTESATQKRVANAVATLTHHAK